MQRITKSIKAGLIVSVGLIVGTITPLSAAELGVGISVGGEDGVNAHVGASLGGARGIDAGVNASVGGGNGVDASTTASIGGGNGVNANVGASVGGTRGVSANVGIGVNGADGDGSSASTGNDNGNGSELSATPEIRQALGRLNDTDRRKMMIRCRDIVSSGGYDQSLAGLCRVLQSMASR